MTSRVYVLTIHYPDCLSESDRTLTHTILRRRSDGPLVVRECGFNKIQRSKDWCKLRYTSGRPYVQAVFTDLTALSLAQEALHAFVPGLPAGVVRNERRQPQRPEVPCTCVLTEARAIQAVGITGTHPAYPYYSQVATCQRHAQLLPKPYARPLASLVQQVREVWHELPTTRHGVQVMIDELPRLGNPAGKTGRMVPFAAEVGHEGRKIALYG